MRTSLGLFTPLLLIASGCGPIATLHHRSAPDSACAADPATGAGPGVLDVTSGRGYVALIAASSPVRMTVESARVHHTRDGDVLTGMPTADTPRLTTSGGTLGAEPTVVPVQLVTAAEAAVLEASLVGSQLQNVDDRIALQASVSLAGGAIQSGELVVELDLCRGCLVPSCAADEVPAGPCFVGQDEGATCVQY